MQRGSRADAGARVRRRTATAGRTEPRPDPLTFIEANTRLLAVRSLPEIRLHTAHQATGLWQLSEPEADGSDPPPPYWAFRGPAAWRSPATFSIILMPCPGGGGSTLGRGVGGW